MNHVGNFKGYFSDKFWLLFLYSLSRKWTLIFMTDEAISFVLLVITSFLTTFLKFWLCSEILHNSFNTVTKFCVNAFYIKGRKLILHHRVLFIYRKVSNSTRLPHCKIYSDIPTDICKESKASYTFLHLSPWATKKNT